MAGLPIDRVGTTARWSDVVVHNGTVYIVDVPASTDGDVTAQATQLLAQLAAALEANGSGPHRLLLATIYLKDIAADLAAFNAVWDAWVPAGTAPARCCVQARMANDGYLVEIQLVAAAGH